MQLLKLAIASTVFLNAFGLTLALGSGSGSASSCNNSVSNYGVVSTDQEYKALMASKPDSGLSHLQTQIKRNNELHTLLKKALYPIALRLKELEQSIDRTRIDQALQSRSEILQINESDVLTPANRSPYTQIKPMAPDYKAHAHINSGASQSGNVGFYQFHKKPYIQVHSSKKVLWIERSLQIKEEMGWVHDLFSILVTPVGGYGPEFAQQMMKTTAVMMEILSQDPILRKLSAEIYNSNSELLKDHAARATHATSENAVPTLTPLSGTIEGVLSFHQFISATLGDKIEGVATGREALQKIAESGKNEQLGLTADFTSRLSMGIIGPLNLTGQYFPKVYVLDASGKLELTPEIKKSLAELTSVQMKSGRKSRCPMSSFFSKLSFKPKSEKETVVHEQESHQAPPGLQNLAELYFRVFQLVNESK